MSFKNEFIEAYLRYVEDTESPRSFHIWAAISGVAACLGRRNYLPWGPEELFPNLYVVLVGPPAARKSDALKILRRRLTATTGIRFAPKDTGEQRQGLIVAMQNLKPKSDDKISELIEHGQQFSPDALMKALKEDESFSIDGDARDKHVMYACLTEFTSLLQKGGDQMMTFMIEAYDGEDYSYRLKNEERVLTDPLLNIFACTQSSTLAQVMPANAIDQGFTSRIIFVYADKAHKDVADRLPLPVKEELEVERLFNFLYSNFSGEFKQSAAAKDCIKSHYKMDIEMNDQRFIHYIQRRDVHIRKVAMCFAAMRRSHTISLGDVENAINVLKMTERSMPDALGQYGYSPLSLAKQRLFEYFRSINEPISAEVLWAVMHKDMKRVDFWQSINDMINAKLILQITTTTGPKFIAVDTEQRGVDSDLMKLLSENSDDNNVVDWEEFGGKQ